MKKIKPYTAVEEGDWGPVEVMRGEHKGKTGYYDDDHYSSAIVYFGTPFASEYYFIKRRYLKIAEQHEPTTVLAKTMPQMVEMAGIEYKREFSS